MFGFQFPFHAPVERADILLIGNGIEAQHRFLVGHFGEFIQRRRADALGRRVAGDQVGVRDLEVDQFAKESVVLGVGDLRTIFRVVEVVVMPDFSAERRDPLFDIAVGHGLVTHE